MLRWRARTAAAVRPWTKSCTWGSNATASPIGDSPPLLIALGAQIVLCKGEVRRTLALEDYFIDYRVTARQESEFIERSLTILESGLIIATILVMIIIVASLGVRQGLMVGMSIPISFMIAFLVVQILGMTINMMIMFGLVLAVGVLVDDLITLGTKEPYRMFTSRAEYRLMLREDNADQRLTAKGRELGLVDDVRWAAYCEKMDAIERETQRLKSTWVHPGSAMAEAFISGTGQELSREYSLMDLLRRPQVSYAQIQALGGSEVSEAVGEQIEIMARYAGYIDRQAEEIERLKRHEETRLPDGFDYDRVSGLSNEVRAKLKQVRPETLAHAARIPGVTPAAVSLLMIWMKKNGVSAHVTEQAAS